MTAERSGGAVPQGAMAVPVTAATRLRAHWQALRRGEALPRRDQFEPRLLAPILGSMFLLDRAGDGAIRFLIAGRGLVRLYGMELRAAPMTLLFDPAHRGAAEAVVAGVLDRGETADLDLISSAREGRPLLRARAVLLPLGSRRGQRSMVLGTLEVAGETGLTPRRFAIERCLRVPLAGGVTEAAPPPRGAPLLRLVE